jgi:hypothetical protein
VRWSVLRRSGDAISAAEDDTEKWAPVLAHGPSWALFTRAISAARFCETNSAAARRTTRTEALSGF